MSSKVACLKPLSTFRRVASCGAASLLFGLAPQAHAEFSGNATLTTNYMWRGVSQSDRKPAVQAGLQYSHESGLYASVWGSSVKFVPDNGARTEFNFVAGWSGNIAPDWALDVYGLRYQYPAADDDLNWNEINASLTWRENYWLAIAHSTNAMGSGYRGTYLQLGARYPLNDQFSLEGSVSRYFLEKAYGDSYTHGSVGVSWAFQAPFEARLTYHVSDAKAKRMFPGLAGSRVEFAISAAF
ncbi:hypothetical protein H0484_13225 [Pusillimonas sp. CC-YST705]|uniref:Uncharacterized protein n=1 Tax=Mesopusillimonas faecipullorum TaxID=2755040 RepID=A0ABS8CFV7_9BURK|nr:TorF family putative porin [Mesopusillimonas faecipullorum]MCB5364712.1 hypothetical protein [Mesopusillimonas faecipullorum]